MLTIRHLKVTKCPLVRTQWIFKNFALKSILFDVTKVSFWGAAIAQWIRLCLPFYHPGFESKARHLGFYHFKSHLSFICHVKRTKIIKKRPSLAIFIKKYLFLPVASSVRQMGMHKLAQSLGFLPSFVHSHLELLFASLPRRCRRCRL